MNSALISVFTPTYNRADTLHRVWESLLVQTYRNFEWVIIDDGSQDNIEEVVAEYAKIAAFPIIFHKFPSNKGKHNATNKALSLANGEFFIVADSDDAFQANAIALFYDTWLSIPIAERVNFCGVRACCQDQNGNRISDFVPTSPFDATMAEVYYKHNFRKESWCMVDTAWHRNFLFPEDHVGYYPEGIIWKAMSRTKKLRFVNDATRVYYTDDFSDSIMRKPLHPTKKISRNLVSTTDILNNDCAYLFDAPKIFIFAAILHIVYSCYEKQLFKRFFEIITWKGKTLLAIFLMPSIFIYIVHKIKNEGNK